MSVSSFFFKSAMFISALRSSEGTTVISSTVFSSLQPSAAQDVEPAVFDISELIVLDMKLRFPPGDDDVQLGGDVLQFPEQRLGIVRPVGHHRLEPSRRVAAPLGPEQIDIRVN